MLSVSYKKYLLVLIAVLFFASAMPVRAADLIPNNDPGNSFAFSFGTGIQGIFSMFEAGMKFPKINKSMTLSVNGRWLSSLTWATYIKNDSEYVSFHPSVIGGAVSIGGSSPMLRDVFKPYGAFEVLLGYSFTPWDNLINHTGNLIGKNLTFALTGYFGLEVFPSDRISIFFEAGGGFKSLFGDKQNLYVIGSGWLGSGVTARMGVNFYR
jgi:hypothetical protein